MGGQHLPPGALLASMFDHSPAAVALVRVPDFVYEYVNTAYRALARGKGEVLGRTLPEVWAEVGDGIVEALQGVVESGQPYQATEREFRVERGEGPEDIWVSFAFAPIRGGDGRVESVLITLNEVTDHIRRSRWLASSHELTAGLLGARTRQEVARVVFERGLTVLGADAAALAVRSSSNGEELEIVGHFGYPPEATRGWERIPLAVSTPIGDAARQGETVWVPSPEAARARYPGLGLGSKSAHGAWAALPLTVDGVTFGALGLSYRHAQPFTAEYRSILSSVVGRTAIALARASALDALRASQERLELALGVASIGIWEWDLTNRTLSWSPDTFRILGLDPAAGPPAAADAFANVVAEDRPRVEALVQGAEAGERFSSQHRVLRADGEVRWVSVLGRAERAADGSVRILGTIRDITEERAAEAALRELDQRRTAFLAVLSHELRNPLAPMKNSLAVLDRADPGSELDQRARSVLLRQTDHLSRLVDDLLDVSRVAHGKVELRLERIDACEVARRACEDARSVCEQRGLTLVYPSGGPLWVDADPARLAQMIGNLLHNAAKFTPRGGHVEVALRAVDGACEIEVHDDGVGIDPEELRHLFVPFAQAERTRQASHGGLGLGLALVKELAARHGGSVRAASDGVGRGSRFVVTLPLASAPEAPAAAPAPAPVRSGLSVLVVEDNEDAGATLCDLLSTMGHHPELAQDGAAALAIVARRAPDVMVCDIGLPGMDGHEVVRRLREQGARVFAIALSGYAQRHDREQALSAGFDAHLAKPPDFDALTALLLRAAERSLD